MALHAMDDHAQARGYAFERFLKNWFNVWGLDARGAFKLVGEQIDGSFLHRNSVYLIEARWRNSRTDASALRAFQEKVGDRLEGSRGLLHLLFWVHRGGPSGVHCQARGNDGWDGYCRSTTTQDFTRRYHRRKASNRGGEASRFRARARAFPLIPTRAVVCRSAFTQHSPLRHRRQNLPQLTCRVSSSRRRSQAKPCERDEAGTQTVLSNRDRTVKSTVHGFRPGPAHALPGTSGAGMTE